MTTIDMFWAMRPQHWVKNLIVFTPPLFAFELDPKTLLLATGAFVAFSLVASGFYLVNDIFDMEHDQAHPLKRNRPIASGKVSARMAAGTAVGLITIGIACGFAFMSYRFGLVLVAFALVQVAYNTALKHKVIMDIMTIAAGFVLRAVGGGVATFISISEWFALSVGFLALFLGVEKRKAELQASKGDSSARRVLEDYSSSWLHRMENVVTSGALICYCLWAAQGAQTSWMLLSVPFVVYAIFKYQHLTELGAGEAPEETLLTSPHMVVSVLLWVLTVIIILYLTSEPNLPR